MFLLAYIYYYTEWLTSRRVPRPKFFASIYLLLLRMIDIAKSVSPKIFYWYIHNNTEWLSLRGVLRPKFFTSNEYQYTGRKKCFCPKIFISIIHMSRKIYILDKDLRTKINYLCNTVWLFMKICKYVNSRVYLIQYQVN